ncbi:MAG TPA: hypothetical protein VH679_02845, partial [Vicinamibacterales bacterium]
MRRLRLASLLALVLALTGGFAPSGPAARGTRLVASIAWFKTSGVIAAQNRITQRLARCVRCSGQASLTKALPIAQAPAFSTARHSHS